VPVDGETPTNAVMDRMVLRDGVVVGVGLSVLG